ncbi:MAG: peptidase U32 family protein [Sporolactobacillus sp.]
MNLIATAESQSQAEALLDAGVDTLYIGSDPFGLRLPAAFDIEAIAEVVAMAHRRGRRVSVACNALLNNTQIDAIPTYLATLTELHVDAVTVGDPGTVFVLEELGLPLSYIYDGETLVTSARQIQFWLKRGASGVIAARELTLAELYQIQETLSSGTLEVQVYGPTCIHQSGRPLLSNYYRYADMKTGAGKARRLYLRDPKHSDSQYPIYEDDAGTHIFSTYDLSLIDHLTELFNHGLHTWKLDGVLLGGAPFVAVAALFAEARDALLAGRYSADSFRERLVTLQPPGRPLSAGFYTKNPQDVH